VGGCYVYTYLEVPTMSAGFSVTNTPVWIQGSSDNVNFRRYTNPDNTANTLVVGINDVVVASSVSNRIVPLPNFALRYVRLEISGTATGANAAPPTFKIIAISNQ